MNILIVSGYKLLRQAFIHLIQMSSNDLYEFFEASTAWDALSRLHTQKIDLTFVVQANKQSSEFQVCKIIHEEQLGIPCIVFASSYTPHEIDNFWKIGVQVLLLGDETINDLRTAMEVALGKQVSINSRKRIKRPLTFSTREISLLNFLQNGLTSKEIASRMNLKENTVRTYRERLMKKTETRTSAQLISVAFRSGALT